MSRAPPAICPTLESTGSCSVTDCPYNHVVFKCDPCKITFNTQEHLNAHLKTKSHRNKVAGAGGVFYCSICPATILGVKTWGIHIAGRKHTRKAIARGVSPDVEPEEAPIPPGSQMCSVCRYVVAVADWNEHITMANHRRREQFRAFQSVLDDASKDRNGITVSYGDNGIDFEVVDPGDTVQAELSLRLVDPRARVRFIGVKLAQGETASHSGFTVAVGSAPGPFMYGREKRVVVSFEQPMLGHYSERLELLFEDTALRQPFFILRVLKAISGNRVEYEEMRPTEPYTPKPRSFREPEADIVEGPRPESTAANWVAPLPRAPIPEGLEAILDEPSTGMFAQLKRTYVPREVNPKTYGRFWKAVIWIEEYRAKRDLQIYDIEDATLTPREAHAVGVNTGRHAALSSRRHYLFYLEVPGLAEKRPSVLIGDRILVRPPGTSRGRWYEGHVHVVRQAEVGLRFHESFPSRESDGHHVRFLLNRTPLRRQHQALDVAFTAERLLFPTGKHVVPSRVNIARFRPFNPLITGNGPQMDAVKAVLNLPEGAPPFVIFGPPGTGKTITLVESILQFVTNYPNSHVLICAPSNSAADLVAQRLSTRLRPEQLFRYYAPSRSRNDVPDELLPYTLVDREGHLGTPPVAILKRFRAIVCTCVSASFACGLGIQRGHFNAIFVDEAGQATEPEVMIAIKTMSDLQTNVVLAGDPKQLGPIIRSSIARKFGLERSYLERLMGDGLYDHHTGHGRTVVKLTKNYRSHDAILTFPNQRFYGGELLTCADARTRDSCLDGSILVNKKFPVVFHAMSGKDDRESSSPSFFNISEVQQIRQYVEALRSDRRLRVSYREIGIIAPYHAQCQKIRRNLRAIGAEDIKVGSTEEFQGQERRVMLISTVRSSREFVEYDLRHTLGFVANPRRFNVAVTRAQALLVIVGDPDVLGLDPLWRSFLNYIHKNGGWKGLPIPWDARAAVREEGGYDAEARARGQTELDELAARVQAMSVEAEEDDAAVERPWADRE